MVTDYQDISVSFAPDGTKETEMTITIDGNVVEKAIRAEGQSHFSN